MGKGRPFVAANFAYRTLRKRKVQCCAVAVLAAPRGSAACGQEIAAGKAISKFGVRAQRTALMRMTHASPSSQKSFLRKYFCEFIWYFGFSWEAGMLRAFC